MAITRSGNSDGGRTTGGGTAPNMLEGFQDLMREMLERQEERIMGNFQTMLRAQKDEIEENVRRIYEEQPSIQRTRGETGDDQGSLGGRFVEESEEPKNDEEEPLRVRCSYKDFNGCNPPTYSGASDPIVLHNWINEMEMAFTACQCWDGQKTGFAVTKLKADALQWWIEYQGTNDRQVIEQMTWEEFLEELKGRFCTVEEIRSLEKEFLGFKKGTMTLSNYNSRFLKLMSFSRRLVPDEGAKIAQYVDGLPYQVQMSMGEPTTLHHAMRIAIKLDKTTETHAKEEGKNRLGKRKLEENPNDEDEIEDKKSGTRQRSKGRDERSKPIEEVVCFKCGDLGHYANSCPKGTKCFECKEFGHISTQCPNKNDGSGKVVKKDGPKAKGRTYQITAGETRGELDVTTGKFLWLCLCDFMQVESR